MAVNFQIVSEISIKEKSKVYLITIDDTPPFYVLKRYCSDAAWPVFEQLRNISSSFFPRILDLWCENGEVCIIEEYVAGRTLREVMDEEGVTVSEAVQYMAMLCEAMGILHNHKPKLVHRDIKPENIIIDEEGRLKLIDFDSIRVHKSEAYYDTVMMGTREYASPEQFGFRQTDERSDIYSAGSIFRELIRDSNRNQRAVRKISKIIDKATMFDPEKRYQSAEQMLRDIQQIDKFGISVWQGVVPAAVLVILLAGGFLWSNVPKSIVNVNNGRSDTEDYVEQDAEQNEMDSTIEDVTDGIPETLSETETENSLENTVKDTQEIEENKDFEQDAETGTSDNMRVVNLGGPLYCWSDEHWSFWGFEDSYAYPDEYYILSELEGSPVTEIGVWALGGKEKLRKLYVPASVTFIGENAFYSTHIVFYGESGSYIEEYCGENGFPFNDDEALALFPGWELHMDGPLYHWSNDHWVFWGFENGYPVPNEYYIPAEIEGSPVTEIGDWALGDGEKLRHLHVPASVTFIGEDKSYFTKMVFYGETGSYIEEFCKENGFQFVAE